MVALVRSTPDMLALVRVTLISALVMLALVRSAS